MARVAIRLWGSYAEVEEAARRLERAALLHRKAELAAGRTSTGDLWRHLILELPPPLPEAPSRPTAIYAGLFYLGRAQPKSWADLITDCESTPLLQAIFWAFAQSAEGREVLRLNRGEWDTFGRVPPWEIVLGPLDQEEG
ncbi:MAG: hypothetical protein H0T73_13185 [Ardenticatenales bacterium]|nr:hypothetical protein [Ardenticatenales bacterium]